MLRTGTDGTMTVETTGGQGSGILSSMHSANCFIILPMENDGVAAGDLEQRRLTNSR